MWTLVDITERRNQEQPMISPCLKIDILVLKCIIRYTLLRLSSWVSKLIYNKLISFCLKHFIIGKEKLFRVIIVLEDKLLIRYGSIIL